MLTALGLTLALITGTVTSTSVEEVTRPNGDRLIVTHAIVATPHGPMDVEFEGGTLGNVTMGVSDTPPIVKGHAYRFRLHGKIARDVVQTDGEYVTFAKWPQATVTYYVNPANADGIAPLPDIVAGADAWTLQSAAHFTPVYGGTTQATVVQYDGVNNVLFSPESNGSTIAVTYYWWDGVNTIVDADIKFFDGGFRFFTSDFACSSGQYVLDVATHEFGHVFGIAHSTDPTATMYPTISMCGTGWRTLASDDIAAIESLYPPVLPGTVPSAPSGLRATVAANKKFVRANLSWQDTAANEAQFLVERSRDGFVYTQIAALPANTTSYTDNKLASATTYYYRVRASNSYGFSDYSNVVSVRH